MQFHHDFIWGTAMSAHQTEGNNTNSDWWQWEHSGTAPMEPSNEACDSYNRYEEDFELCKNLNNNAVRISVEWARLEPKEGIFDQGAFDHYKKVLKAAKDRGLKTFVTLHHFTNPVWFSKKGGWLNLKSSYYFARYANKCAKELKDVIDVFLTINEPQVYAYETCVVAQWPPCYKNILFNLVMQLNFIRAHNQAYKNIKKVTNTPVGIVKNIPWFNRFVSKPFSI